MKLAIGEAAAALAGAPVVKLRVRNFLQRIVVLDNGKYQ